MNPSESACINRWILIGSSQLTPPLEPCESSRCPIPLAYPAIRLALQMVHLGGPGSPLLHYSEIWGAHGAAGEPGAVLLAKLLNHPKWLGWPTALRLAICDVSATMPARAMQTLSSLSPKTIMPNYSILIRQIACHYRDYFERGLSMAHLLFCAASIRSWPILSFVLMTSSRRTIQASYYSFSPISKSADNLMARHSGAISRNQAPISSQLRFTLASSR
jgi:hypothetical protein